MQVPSAGDMIQLIDLIEQEMAIESELDEFLILDSNQRCFRAHKNILESFCLYTTCLVLHSLPVDKSTFAQTVSEQGENTVCFLFIFNLTRRWINVRIHRLPH